MTRPQTSPRHRREEPIVAHARGSCHIPARWSTARLAMEDMTNAHEIVERGSVLGWLGDLDENGGWPPHVHFQLSNERPETHDMPGVVALDDWARAMRTYLDPRLVLGELYPGKAGALIE